jgi:hypothetical protein
MLNYKKLFLTINILLFLSLTAYAGDVCIVWNDGVECPADTASGFESEEEAVEVESITETSDVGADSMFDDFDFSDAGMDADIETDAMEGDEAMDMESEETETEKAEGEVEGKKESDPDKEKGDEEKDEEKKDEEKKDEKDKEKKEGKDKDKDKNKDKKKKKKKKKSKTKGQGFKPGETVIGANAKVSTNTSVYSLPLSYSVTDYFKIAVSAPYITTKKVSGMGNPSIAFKFFTGLGTSSALLTSISAKPALGDEKVGARNVTDYQFGQSVAFGFSRSIVFASYFYAYRPVDENKIDKGDSLGAMLGFDMPLSFLSDYINFYTAVMQNETQDDMKEEYSYNNHRILVDTSFGFVFTYFNVRLGLTVPTTTESKLIEHSQRRTVYDIGVRYKI